ncbi:MAG: pyridoxamine 5'-phosphate oxidase family protein [Thermoleophilia bacterium]|nr:pyridoxamine 5'-phosphate oxidase family protein [Thermoleophilia bacterium]
MPRLPQTAEELRRRVADYLQAHHTMTVATVSPEAAGNRPHAATVFYAVDDKLRLVFLSKTTSVHGSHIGKAAPVAVTVAAEYEDWEMIQGVQLWGEAHLLQGAARARAMTLYLVRFPFVRDLLRQPRLGDLVQNLGVYRVEPHRAAFTDNRTGLFGREVLELVVE